MSFFRNMSIKSKFLTAIAALFVVCLAFAVLVLLAMKDISGFFMLSYTYRIEE